MVYVCVCGLTYGVCVCVRGLTYGRCGAVAQWLRASNMFRQLC